MGLLLNVLANALVVFVVAKLVPGFRVKTYGTAVVVAIVYGLLSFFLKWLLVLLSLPFIILTLGLFLLVLNAFLLWMTQRLVDDVEIDGPIALGMATVGITLGHLAVDRVLD
jgi:putative membrane protein